MVFGHKVITKTGIVVWFIFATYGWGICLAQGEQRTDTDTEWAHQWAGFQFGPFLIYAQEYAA